MAITPILVAYIEETEEAIFGWKNYDDNGYYTLSEEKMDVGDSTYSFPAVLYYYPRHLLPTPFNDTVQRNLNLVKISTFLILVQL